MTNNEKFKIIDNNYFDIMIKFWGDLNILELSNKYTSHITGPYFVTFFLPISEVDYNIMKEFGYASVPKCYSLCSMESLAASGVLKLRQIPAIDLRGNGVLVGVLDTGIDYTHPAFMREDGSSKIMAIWDQTIDSENQYPTALVPTYFGTEYNNEQINVALSSENPLLIVPSTDDIGHGTKLAGIAAGNEMLEEKFSGVVPDSDLLVVKLKQAKNNLRDFFNIPHDVPCYQENDIIWGIKYLVFKAKELGRPIAICLGMGTSQGPHDNSGYLDLIASVYADTPGVALSVAVGNEGSLQRHFFSEVDAAGEPISVTLNVDEKGMGLSAELWGKPPATYTIEITSPSGNVIKDTTRLLVNSEKYTIENTTIYIDNFMIEEESGKQLILMRFQNPLKGAWVLRVHSRGDLKGAFHIWLPSGDFITRDTYFLSSDPFTTITSPANSIVPISITAYNTATDALSIDSGRGFSTSNIINPILAAPGVELLCPSLDHGFTYMSGTSAAAAHASGIVAMFMEWGIVRNNYPGLDSVGIMKFLMRGAKRNDLLPYPNREWGYGIIDAYNSLNILRTDF